MSKEQNHGPITTFIRAMNVFIDSSGPQKVPYEKVNEFSESIGQMSQQIIDSVNSPKKTTK